MPLISSKHLELLAGRPDGRDKFGEILHRLIFAWAPNRFRAMSFHLWDTNNFPNWDGWAHLAKLATDRADHLSVWELGTEDPPLPKIRRDFDDARSKNLPPGWDKKNVAYVACTLHRLKDRIKVEKELIKKAKGVWSDIHVIDAEALAQWISLCPSVETWMAEEFNIGNGRYGESLERRWRRWSGVTKPPIAKQLVLAGRDKTQIEEGLKYSNDRLFSLRADSPAEAVALLYAVIDELPQAARDTWLANALVVANADLAHAYADEPIQDGMRRLTILVPPATNVANVLTRRGHYVVNALGRNEPHAQSILVKRSLRSAFEKALEETMRLPAAKAALDARACGSSVSIWRVWNLLNTTSPGKDLPQWAHDTEALLVIPAALIRGWDESCDGDKEIIERLTGKKYDIYRRELQPHLTSDDPLLESAGPVYHLVAPSVAFALLGRNVTAEHLAALESAVTVVFGHLELEVENRWQAEDSDTPHLSQKPKYSEWLRDGLAETLLCIAYLGGFLPPNSVTQYGDGQGYVDRLFRRLKPLREDPRLLASLRDQLPYIAEAAPTPFVEALESLLQGDPARLRPLFADHGFFGPTYHSGLLWALETLAWSPDYLGQVSFLLARLAELDPGGKVSNRPINSLREIYLAWHRGTSATLDQLVEVLRAMHRQTPLITWTLLLMLLPRGSETSTGSHEPTWRDFGRSSMPALTNKVAIETYRAYIALALELARADVERQLDLVDRYAEIGSDHAATLVALLRKSSTSEMDETLRVEAWNRIRKLAAHHKEFSGAAWALPANQIQVLESLADCFAPEDVVQRYRWLFDDQWPDIGYRKAEDVEGKQAKLEELRRDAISGILKEAGWDGIHRLVVEAKYSYLVGNVIAKCVANIDRLASAVTLWGRNASDKEKAAIRSVSAVSASKDRATWSNALLAVAKESKWPPELLGTALLDYPADEETFKLVASQGPDVEKHYWQHRWSPLTHSDASAKRAMAEKYINFGRAADVLDARTADLNELGAGLILRALNATLDQLNKGDLPHSGGMFSWHLGNVFKWLRQQITITRSDLARLEYSFLPLLVGPGNESEETLTLHKFLAEDPEFFVEVLCDLYKPASQEGKQDPDEHTRARAMTAWRLMESWVSPPGVTDAKIVDAKALDEWVTRARALAGEKDRVEVADTQIGKIIFHTPPDPNTQQWPQRPVCDLIERLASKSLDHGFQIECVNSRGVTSRAPLDGGNLERNEETQWRKRAKALGNQWPHTKALFLQIASDWNAQAKWHDDNSDQMRMRWS